MIAKSTKGFHWKALATADAQEVLGYGFPAI